MCCGDGDDGHDGDGVGRGVSGTFPYKFALQVPSRTGGFHDLWCPHETKVGTVMQTLQESVADPCDLTHSMKKLPKLHICDDPCTLGEVPMMAL